MNLLCVLGRHRWATVANPGEGSYQWCQRCLRYRSSSRWRDVGEPTGRGRPSGGGTSFGGHSAQGGHDGFDGGGFDGGGFDGGGGGSN